MCNTKNFPTREAAERAIRSAKHPRLLIVRFCKNCQAYHIRRLKGQ